MDTLESLGYVCQERGYYNRQDGVRRRTRVYAAEPLIELFDRFIPPNFNTIYRLPPAEIIQLRNGAKKFVDYEETEETKAMRHRLYEYNRFLRGQQISIEQIPADLPVRIKFFEDLQLNLLNGMLEASNIEITDLEGLDSLQLSYINDHGNNHHIKQVNISNNKDTNKLEYNSNIIISNKPILLYLYIITITSKVLEQVEQTGLDYTCLRLTLKDLETTKLDLKINYELLHRVFNNNSFGDGGRFFGAFHIGMPKELRPFIHMNGKPTVELDYSALHIRMLYHLKGIDYRDDPYVALCESEEERKAYKLVQLIAINCHNEREAVMAIRDVFRKSEIRWNLTDKEIIRLLDKFKDAHKPIQEYLNSGIGLKLQNMDGKITEKVLTDLMNEGIVALPVHDSYIVDAGYEGILAEKMVEAYETVMGFPPVIG